MGDGISLAKIGGQKSQSWQLHLRQWLSPNRGLHQLWQSSFAAPELDELHAESADQDISALDSGAATNNPSYNCI